MQPGNKDEQHEGVQIVRRDCKLTKLLDDLRREGDLGARYADDIEKAIEEEFRQFKDDTIAEMKQLLAITEYDEYDDAEKNNEEDL